MASDGAGACISGTVGNEPFNEPSLGDADAFVFKVSHPPFLSGISDAFNGQLGSAESIWAAP